MPWLRKSVIRWASMRIVGGGGQTTFPGGDDLHRVKAEHRDGAVVIQQLPPAHRSSEPPIKDRMAGIFQHRESIALGQAILLLPYHSCYAREMHWHHYLRQGVVPLGLLQAWLLQCLPQLINPVSRSISTKSTGAPQ